MMSSRFAAVADLSQAARRSFLGLLRAVCFSAAVVFCGSTALAVPEIAVTLKSTTLTDGGSIDVGSFRQNKTYTVTLTIYNEGSDELTLSNVAVASPFEISASPSATVAPGKRTTVKVRIPAGAEAGPISSELSIENNDANESPFTVTIEADVLPVVPDINVLAGSTVLESGDLFNLGTTEAGVGNSRKFTLQNSGLADLVLSSPSIEGQGFVLDFPKTRVLRAGKKLSFTVRFSGTTAGEFDGLLSLPSNDPDEGDYELELLATLTPADAIIRVFSQGEPLENGDAIDFGSTRSDQRVDRVFTIRNEGRSTLRLGPAEISGTGFSLLSQPRTSLARGKSTKFKVRLDPALSGPSPTGLLTVPNNSPGNEAFAIDLTADVSVVSPLLLVSGPEGSIDNGATITLEPTNINQPLQLTVTISNPGTSTLTLGPVTVTGTGYTLTRAPATSVEPGRTTNFVVRLFSAVLLDPAPGMVSFTSNATGFESFSFSLAGAVRVVPVTPEIEVLETTINGSGNPVMQVIAVGSTRNYGTFPAGNSLIRTYTIRNRGTSALALSMLTLTNTAGPAFSILSGSPLPASLAPAASTTFTIQFLPLTNGDFAANVAFINDDPDDGENPFTFRVTGTATAANIAFDVAYRGFGTVTMTRLPEPLAPIGSRPYPFSLGAIPAGGSTVNHDGALDSFVLTNRGLSPLIVSGAVVIDPVPPSPSVWLGTLNPEPCFPVACPIPTLGQVSINIQHNGLTAGPSRGLVTLDVFGAPALTPWEFEIQEWVNDWFMTNGGLGGGAVRAFTTFDPDGAGTMFTPKIFAGGGFNSPGGSPRIATLTAGTWTALTGGGINTGGSSINALAVYDEPNDSNPALLFAGGTAFTNVGAPAISGVNNIAKWNGTTWAPVGSVATNGVTGGSVNAMVVYGTSTPPTDPASQLYVGGSFTNASGLVVQGIARWNGTSWSKLLTTSDGVVGGEIRAMAVFDTDGTGPLPAELYVAGNFPNVSSLLVPANGIARFNGTSWNTLGIAPSTGVSGAGAKINAIVVFDSDGPEGAALPTLVVAGSFVQAGNVVANSVAQWTGSAWQPFNTGGIGDSPNEVFALTVFDEDAFHPEDNDGDTDNDSSNGTGGLKRRTQPGRLYAAGNFSFMLPSGNFVNNIARWDPNQQQWGPVGNDVSNGTNGEIRALHAFDPDGQLTAGAPNTPEQLFVGGLFTNVIQLSPDPDLVLPINNVAVWSATAP